MDYQEEVVNGFVSLLDGFPHFFSLGASLFFSLLC
jgi:hypothetical protein